MLLVAVNELCGLGQKQTTIRVFNQLPNQNNKLFPSGWSQTTPQKFSAPLHLNLMGDVQCNYGSILFLWTFSGLWFCYNFQVNWRRIWAFPSPEVPL